MGFQVGERVVVPGLFGGWSEGTVTEVNNGKPKVRRDGMPLSFACNVAKHISSSLETSGQCTREFAANRYISRKGNPALVDRAKQYARNTPATRAGFFQETVHVQSFNKNAIAKGSRFRAEMTKPGAAADAVIFDKFSGEIVSEVQFKRYADAKKTQKAFQNPKYDDMQKVGPRDHAGNGVRDCMEYDGVKSDPLSKEQLDKLPQRLQEKDSWGTFGFDVARAAGIGAATGGGTAALHSVTALARGRIDERECVERVVKGTAVGARAGALGHCAYQVSNVSGIVVAFESDDVGAACAHTIELALGTCATVAFMAGSGPLGWTAVTASVVHDWAIKLVSASADETSQMLCNMNQRMNEAFQDMQDTQVQAARLKDAIDDLNQAWTRDYDEAEQLVVCIRRHRAELALLVEKASWESDEGVVSVYDDVAESVLAAANTMVDQLVGKIQILNGHVGRAADLSLQEEDLALKLRDQQQSAARQAQQALDARKDTIATTAMVGITSEVLGLALAPLTFGMSAVAGRVVTNTAVVIGKDGMDRLQESARRATDLAKQADKLSHEHQRKAQELRDVQAHMEHKINSLVAEVNSQAGSLALVPRSHSGLDERAVVRYRMRFARASGLTVSWGDWARSRTPMQWVRMVPPALLKVLLKVLFKGSKVLFKVFQQLALALFKVFQQLWR